MRVLLVYSMKISDFISLVERELGIPKYGGLEYLPMCDAAYSLAGMTAMASLWDHDESEDHISVQHFKLRAKHVIAALCSLSIDISSQMKDYVVPICNEIYNIYLSTGSILRSPHELRAVQVSSCTLSGVTLYRGFEPGCRRFMSGLGFYLPNNIDLVNGSIQQLFSLPNLSPAKIVIDFVKQSEWQSIEWTGEEKFLRTTPPFSSGYWQAKPEKSGGLSIFKRGNGQKTYSIYRFDTGRFMSIDIPQWMLQDVSPGTHLSSGTQGEWRRIALGVFSLRDVFPEINVQISGELAEIRLGYLLPALESHIFNLFSWPMEYIIREDEPSSPFRRRMSLPVYKAFKPVFEGLGYVVKEELN